MGTDAYAHAGNWTFELKVDGYLLLQRTVLLVDPSFAFGLSAPDIRWDIKPFTPTKKSFKGEGHHLGIGNRGNVPFKVRMDVNPTKYAPYITIPELAMIHYAGRCDADVILTTEAWTPRPRELIRITLTAYPQFVIHSPGMITIEASIANIFNFYIFVGNVSKEMGVVDGITFQYDPELTLAYGEEKCLTVELASIKGVQEVRLEIKPRKLKFIKYESPIPAGADVKGDRILVPVTDKELTIVKFRVRATPERTGYDIVIGEISYKVRVITVVPEETGEFFTTVTITDVPPPVLKDPVGEFVRNYGPIILVAGIIAVIGYMLYLQWKHKKEAEAEEEEEEEEEEEYGYEEEEEEEPPRRERREARRRK